MKSIVFVDDEPRVLTALQRQLHPFHQEWDMRFASGGAEGLQFLDQAPADVLVTDMMMPGMDGAQLLEQVLLRHPNTIRIVLSGHTERECILRLVGPAHQYLSKPCDPLQLRETIGRAFALRDLLTNTALKHLVSQTQSLPSLPMLYLELMNELRSGEPSMDRVGEIIARDMAMSAKILQLVNSAFFGLAHRVPDPAEAAFYLGLETVKSLVLSTQVFSQFTRYQANVPEFPFEALWQHCWNTGVRVRRIARAERLEAEMGNQCFVSALLHDVGKLILAAGQPAAFRQALALAREHRISLWQAEKELLGSSHAELGAYLLGLWNFPNSIVEAVALHHRPGGGLKPELDGTTLVHVANALDHDLRPDDQPGADGGLDLDYLRLVGAETRLEDWIQLCMTIDSSQA
jgi:HD-like signal output (HDOD) protein